VAGGFVFSAGISQPDDQAYGHVGIDGVVSKAIIRQAATQSVIVVRVEKKPVARTGFFA
jgi:hypothetical protein